MAKCLLRPRAKEFLQPFAETVGAGFGSMLFESGAIQFRAGRDGVRASGELRCELLGNEPRHGNIAACRGVPVAVTAGATLPR